MPPFSKQVYFFGSGRAEGTHGMEAVLGVKGAGLAEMTNLGLPVPPGFTIACGACAEYLRGESVPAALRDEVVDHVARLEAVSGRRLGDPRDPLLVSVRSGAPASMPGMLGTVLNLGLNDDTVGGLATRGDARFAYDSLSRFVRMYGELVLGVPHHELERPRAPLSAQPGADAALTPETLRALVEQYRALVARHAGQPVPSDPWEQLWGAIEAVWRSWTLKKARDYRRVHAIPETLGTAVNVVAMVFGNLGEDSGTGVAFTRDPSTGEKRFYGEFLVNAQGEDVVAGVRTPLRIEAMAERLPEAYAELLAAQEGLEQHFREMQDIEFTVERRKLYLLQTRAGKPTARAALRIAVEMVEEGLIDRAEAVRRVGPERLGMLLRPMIDPNCDVRAIAVGLPASPGVASGCVALDPETAARRAARGVPVILVREETTVADFDGIVAADAVLTARGGMTSHAAVICRGLGKCAVVGCQDLAIDVAAGRLTVAGQAIGAGDWITVDGDTGRVFTGRVPTVARLSARTADGAVGTADRAPLILYERVCRWADELRDT